MSTLLDVQKNQQRKTEVATLLASAARTTSGTSAEFDSTGFKEVAIYLNVTAASGTTPTLDLKAQSLDPVSGVWMDIPSGALTQKTAAGTELKVLSAGLGNRMRISYTIAGTTPSFTFSLGAASKRD